jgi:hypothetical protein
LALQQQQQQQQHEQQQREQEQQSDEHFQDHARDSYLTPALNNSCVVSTLPANAAKCSAVSANLLFLHTHHITMSTPQK